MLTGISRSEELAMFCGEDPTMRAEVLSLDEGVGLAADDDDHVVRSLPNSGFRIPLMAAMVAGLLSAPIAIGPSVGLGSHVASISLSQVTGPPVSNRSVCDSELAGLSSLVDRVERYALGRGVDLHLLARDAARSFSQKASNDRVVAADDADALAEAAAAEECDYFLHDDQT
jgi:hypothetical protein